MANNYFVQNILDKSNENGNKINKYSNAPFFKLVLN